MKHEDVLDPANPVVGSECTVKVANRTYQERLAAVGKYTVQLTVTCTCITYTICSVPVKKFDQFCIRSVLKCSSETS